MMQQTIIECRKSGQSWVAVDENGKLVGFDRLVKNGFAKIEADAKETRFRWAPNPS
jgi:hypothetical protein